MEDTNALMDFCKAKYNTHAGKEENAITDYYANSALERSDRKNSASQRYG